MNLNKKRIGLVTAWLISLLIVATVVYVVFAQTASTFWIGEGVYPSANSFTIWREGSYYFAKNAYGQLPFSSRTNSSDIINDARGGLTNGRIFKETLFLKGDITLTHPILLDSYTTIQIDGKITLASGFPNNTGAIQNLDQVNGNAFIDIIGGQIDGNKENQANQEIYGVFFRYVDDSRILNVDINRTKSSGIYASLGCDRNIIQGNMITYAGYAGIVIEGQSGVSDWSTDNRLTSNTVKFNDKDGITCYRYAIATIISQNIANNNGRNPDPDGGGSGIRADSTADKTQVQNNIANNNDYDGIQIIDSNDCIVLGNVANQNGNSSYAQVDRGDGIEVYDTAFRTIVSNNQANENERQGIVINGESYGAIVTDNELRANGWSGIRVYRTPKVIINNNLAMDNGQAGNITEADGIKVDDEGNPSAYYNVTIVGNLCLNSLGSSSQEYGIEVKDSYDGNVIVGNQCIGNANGSWDIVYSGTLNKVAYNIGRYTQQGSA